MYVRDIAAAQADPWVVRQHFSGLCTVCVGYRIADEDKAGMGLNEHDKDYVGLLGF